MNRYRKGYMKEREIVNQMRKLGYIAFRSAGSHSPIDVCVVRPKEKTISFLQVKWSEKAMSENEKKKIRGMMASDGLYFVDFKLITKR